MGRNKKRKTVELKTIRLFPLGHSPYCPLGHSFRKWSSELALGSGRWEMREIQELPKVTPERSNVLFPRQTRRGPSCFIRSGLAPSLNQASASAGGAIFQLFCLHFRAFCEDLFRAQVTVSFDAFGRKSMVESRESTLLWLQPGEALWQL